HGNGRSRRLSGRASTRPEESAQDPGVQRCNAAPEKDAVGGKTVATGPRTMRPAEDHKTS
ncbi:hypothetical protein ACI3PL_23435, partial [Lacticaseibacillus paracasei]